MSQHSKQRLAALAGLVIVLAAAHPAWAQRGRGFRRLFGVPEAQLATLDEVQTELKMTDEQKTRVAEINDELGEKRRELWGTGFEGWSEIRPRMEGLNRDASESVDKVLDPAQRQRLQEIAIQQNGPRALDNPEVVAELGLSDEQKAKLAAAGEENSEAFEKSFAESGREDWRQKAGELADEADKRLLGVLTDEQKSKFKQMEGKEFEVDLSQLFRGGRGGR
jgi:hypothetical protein